MAQLPIATFLKTRLTEFDPTFELRKGTGFEQLFFKPIEFIVQPLRDEANDLFIAQSFRRILQTEDPNAFDEEAVDALASNLFIPRREGNKSGGPARAFYNEPVDREYPAGGAVFTDSTGQVFTNPSPFKITGNQMSTQIDDGLYYFDIQVESQDTGESTAINAGDLVALAGDTDIVRVTNLVDFTGGVDHETNIEFITRVQNSIGVRDLVAGKGFNAILFENFADSLQEVQPIGFGDDEMMRDIVYNVHIGGRVDGFAKTASIKTGAKDFVGLLVDTTRQTRATANVQLFGITFAFVGNPNIDRSNGLAPVVMENKLSTSASYTSTVDLSDPINLAANQYVKIGIDGVFKNVRVAGVTPATTARNEIINLINAAFGTNVAFVSGNTIRVTSLTTGLTSQVVLDNPDSGTNALLPVFGLSPGSAPFTFDGDGPVTYIEGVHYNVNDGDGLVQRIIGTTILSTQVTGSSVTDSDVFNDPTSNQFLNVLEKDIVTINSGPDAGDYRVVEKIDDNNLRLDAQLTDTNASVSYSIARTGIKDAEVVYVIYYFNPLSIDVGKLVKLDPIGKTRGIRPGRENQTITDLVFLRVVSIEVIDALTKEPTGQVLDGSGGWGQGGWGQGPYGIGQGSEYRLIVNSPTERFSMFEDSYIVINTEFEALSFRVNYEYVPEFEVMHTFVRSETERVLDGDILMRHFMPAYVKAEIEYSVDSTDISVPTNDALTLLVKDFINSTRSGLPLEQSDIIQFIARHTDTSDKFGTFVRPFPLSTTVHNADGTINKFSSDERLEIPKLNPFPLFTTRPLSARITHWIADEVTLTRLDS